MRKTVLFALVSCALAGAAGAQTHLPTFDRQYNCDYSAPWANEKDPGWLIFTSKQPTTNVIFGIEVFQTPTGQDNRRIAFATLRLVGTRPAAIVAGLMGATAFLSMWVSNTATCAMMVPIALSVIDVALRRRTGKGLEETGGIPEADRDLRHFALSALLGVAYAASIGGLGTIVGSPPNGILVRYVEQASGGRVSFLDWMRIGLGLCWVARMAA